MKPEYNIDDAISAGSLVLAVLAALYTLWLSEVNAALAIKPRADRDDRGPQMRQVMDAITTKALPLTCASLATFLIFLPRTAAILFEVFIHFQDWTFDDIKALFVITNVLLLFLMGAAIAQVVALFGKRVDLMR